RMAEEGGSFTFDDVADAISDKMERRHPHVFGGAVIPDAAAQTEAWEAHKAAERRAAGGASVPDGGGRAFPPLLRPPQNARRAARIGFDWSDAASVIEKIREEIAEVEAEIARAAAREKIEEEVGDLLFAAASLARKLDIEPEAALRRATAKFERRFRLLEAL